MVRYERLRQRWVDRAALRTFERLLAQPSSFDSSPSDRAALALSGLVLVLAVAYLIFLTWAALHARGVVGWFFVTLGWAVAFAARPRHGRLPSGVTRLRREDYPALHEVVDRMSAAVGVRPPQVLGVYVGFNAYVTSIGPPFAGGNAMVIGLPLFSLGGWSGRLGVLGHELGHLRGRDTVRRRVLASAAAVVDGLRYLLSPSQGLAIARSRYPNGATLLYPLAAGIANLVQSALVAPLHLLALLMQRLELSAFQHREYLADRRAAEVVGADALIEFLLLNYRGLATTAGAAARRGQDPFEVLLGRPPMTPVERKHRLAQLESMTHPADATHPPDHLRIRLLQVGALRPGPNMPDAAVLAAAETELTRLRREHRRALVELAHSGRF